MDKTAANPTQVDRPVDQGLTESFSVTVGRPIKA